MVVAVMGNELSLHLAIVEGSDDEGREPEGRVSYLCGSDVDGGEGGQMTFGGDRLGHGALEVVELMRCGIDPCNACCYVRQGCAVRGSGVRWTRGDGNLLAFIGARFAQTRKDITTLVRGSKEHLLEEAETAEERRREVHLLAFGDRLAVQLCDLPRLLQHAAVRIAHNSEGALGHGLVLEDGEVARFRLDGLACSDGGQCRVVESSVGDKLVPQFWGSWALRCQQGRCECRCNHRHEREAKKHKNSVLIVSQVGLYVCESEGSCRLRGNRLGL